MDKSLFCEHHGKIDHFVFSNYETACLTCALHLLEYECPDAAVVVARIRNAISELEFQELLLPDIQKLKEAILAENDDIAFLGLVVCQAVRKKMTVENVILDIESRGSFL